MTEKLFDRRAAITVDTLRVQGDHIDETGAFVRGLRLTFKVTQTLDSKQNTADATISNLSAETRGRLAALKRPTFVIEAGYTETLATVFLGRAHFINSLSESPGWITKIAASDGHEGARVVNAALAPGATLAQAIETLAASAGVNAEKAIADARAGKFDGPAPTFYSGLVLCGTICNEMDKLAKTSGFNWSIEGGELKIWSPNQTSTEEAVVLSPETGLIGSPERIADKKNPSRTMYKARSLLQPLLRPGRRVRISATDVRGEFKCVRVEHTGDTNANDWYSECQVIEVRP